MPKMISLAFSCGTNNGTQLFWNIWKHSTKKSPSFFAADRKSTRLNSSHSQISYAAFFFNDTAPTEIYPLPLHDALPISPAAQTMGPSFFGIYGNTRQKKARHFLR